MLADRRVVAERKAHDEIVRAGGLRSRHDLALGGVRLAEGDVGADRVAEQVDVLPDIAGLGAQRMPRYAGYVLAVDQDLALLHLIEPQQQRQHRRFAAAGGADQSGGLAGLGDEAHGLQHRLVRPVGEIDVAKLDPCVREFQRRLVVVGGLARRAVDDLEQHPRTDQLAVEVDIETGQALGRLGCQQERGHEGEKLSGRGAERDHAVAAIEQAAGDRKAAEHFHQRVGAIGDPRHLVGVPLDDRDVLVDAPLHGRFQRERLHRADALQRFLHGLHDVGAAGELIVGEALDALHQLAQDQHRRRHHHEADKRQHRILRHHHEYQADQQQHVASDGVDQQRQHVGDGFGARCQPRQEFGRMPLGIESDALAHQLGKQPPLVVGEDGVADLR